MLAAPSLLYSRASILLERLRFYLFCERLISDTRLIVFVALTYGE